MKAEVADRFWRPRSSRFNMLGGAAVSHVVASVCGAIAFSWWSSLIEASSCPACQVSCGSLTCPAVHCATGHIEIGPIAGAVVESRMVEFQDWPVGGPRRPLVGATWDPSFRRN